MWYKKGVKYWLTRKNAYYKYVETVLDEKYSVSGLFIDFTIIAW